jgi:hypothetical protein
MQWRLGTANDLFAIKRYFPALTSSSSSSTSLSLFCLLLLFLFFVFYLLFPSSPFTSSSLLRLSPPLPLLAFPQGRDAKHC